MTEDETASARDDEPKIVEAVAPAISILGFVLRLAARIWVTSLLLAAAAFGGISVYQLMQTRAELSELRKQPGPESYAVVAYQRELERQVRAYEQNWRAD